MIQNSNFAHGLKVKKLKKLKHGSKGGMSRSSNISFKFWDPPNTSGMAEDTNLKFCMRIDGKGY